jgi:glucose-6-phosphate 1-epimerase
MKRASDFLRHEIPGVAKFIDTSGGLVRLDITTALATAEIYIHGAHVAAFQPVGQAPGLFLSSKSHLTPGKAIRGGVPLIFPWFGPHPTRTELPAHGFIRTSEWDLESLEQSADGGVHLALRFASNDATRAMWPHEFALRFRISIGAALEMTLETENTSSSPFTFEDALHTYLTVADVTEINVRGLSGVEFIDKTAGGQRFREGSEPIRIRRETDRLYLNTTSICSVDDFSLARRIVVEKSGSNSTVVWNPWQGKGMSLADLGPEWPGMICIETVNAADNAVTLQPGARHSTRALIHIESL